MYHLKIDDKEIDVPKGTTVLNAARMAEIEIPTLCDHPNLEPYGGCRLCLVEVEGARTLQPSCTLPVTNDMVVRTSTEKVKAARKFVLSMIFSERNHFCPFCQVSGGDCELQNSAYQEDMTHWPLQPNWQPFEVDASHPFFILDHNRCILCRRCVRACAELVGNYTLGMEERGSKTLLVADLGIPLGTSSCISCGTCVQICPTGALIDRWSAYRGHESDVTRTESICVGCSIGCGIEVVSRNNNLIRVDGNWDAEINQGVLCEIGRFYPLDEKRERIATPLIRKDGSLKAATWEDALSLVSEKLSPFIGKKDNGIAALASTRLPAEALFNFKQIFVDHFGSEMVTSTEEGQNTSFIGGFSSNPELINGSLQNLENADVILTIGTDLTKDHQLAGFFVKRLIGSGAKVIPVSYQAGGMDAFTPYSTVISKKNALAFVNSLESAVKAVLDEKNDHFNESSSDDFRKFAELLANAQNAAIVFGSDFEVKQTLSIIKSLVDLANLVNAKIINFKGNANSLVASYYRLDKAFQMNGHKAGFIALGDEDPSQSLLQKIENIPYLVVQASYHSPLTAGADIVLPVTNWLEQEGHYVNADGKIQKANRAITPSEEIRSNLEVLNQISEKLNFSIQEDWETALTHKTSIIETV